MNYEKVGKAFILTGLMLTIFFTVVFVFNYAETNNSLIDTSVWGQYGDIIGGCVGTIVALVGVFLLFETLKQQRLAFTHENETANLNQLYSYLDQSISNFKFTTLPIENLKNIEDLDTKESVTGGDAFYKLFSQIRCHYHATPEELFQNQSVSELYSILTIMELLLDKLENSKSKNKDILKTLTKHQFDYKIVTRIRDEETESLKLEFCDTCECNHGLPDELKNLIGRIRAKFSES